MLTDLAAHWSADLYEAARVRLSRPALAMRVRLAADGWLNACGRVADLADDAGIWGYWPLRRLSDRIRGNGGAS